jgi:hypothetical protein
MSSAPTFDVMMMIVLRKSTFRPLASVRRTVVHDLEQDVEDLRWAFSISSQQDTEYDLRGPPR